MKITKCNLAIKCDADGCGNLATEDVSFDGVTTQMRFCDQCFKKLREAVKKIRLEGESDREKDKTRV